tara:strand:- start:288 stop:677 length:390 start_codon:yes stop_codon:yes gene_type:complete
MTRHSAPTWDESVLSGWDLQEGAISWHASSWIASTDTEDPRLDAMAAIQDPTLVKLCAQLASRLSISLASARRQVEQAAAREGHRDVQGRRATAESMLAALDNDNGEHARQLNTLLEHSEGDGNFMLED